MTFEWIGQVYQRFAPPTAELQPIVTATAPPALRAAPCTLHAHRDASGRCVCDAGYDRDASNRCVPVVPFRCPSGSLQVYNMEGCGGSYYVEVCSSPDHKQVVAGYVSGSQFSRAMQIATGSVPTHWMPRIMVTDDKLAQVVDALGLTAKVIPASQRSYCAPMPVCPPGYDLSAPAQQCFPSAYGAASPAAVEGVPDQLGQVPAHAMSPAHQLRESMRKLWTDHVVWTRLVIVSFAGGLPDLQVAEQRLLRNQDDLGRAVAQYYGAQAGTQLTQLLKTHIMQAVDVLKAAKSGNKAALDAANAAWQKNGDQIADFLSTANPYLDRAATRALMRKHLNTTLAEAAARLKGDWAADAAAYDAVYDHILTMSDAISAAIARQFGLGGAA